MVKKIFARAFEGETLSVSNATIVFKLLSENSDGKFCVTENMLPPDFPGPPPHKHRLFEHIWYVLDGTLTVSRNGVEKRLQKGEVVFIPRGEVHTFFNESSLPVRYLAIDTPGGLEQYYVDLHNAFSEGNMINPGVIRDIQLTYDTYPPDQPLE